MTYSLPDRPVMFGEASSELWNYLVSIGWARHPYDPADRIYPPEYDGPPVTDGTYWDLPTKPVFAVQVPEDLWFYLFERAGWKYNPYAYGDYLTPPGYTGPFPPTETEMNYELPDAPVPAWQISDGLREFLVFRGWNVRTRSGWVYTGGWSNSLESGNAYRGAEAVNYTTVGATIKQNSQSGIYDSWRFIAQRATTGEFLDMDLPLHLDSLTWELSGPGALKAWTSPDIGTLRAGDGRMVLEEWGTLIYAEADGQIRWGGIVINSKFDGPKWTIEAAGFTTYPHGLPYTGLYSQTGVDPAQAFAHIWRHVQGYLNGNLNVVVTDAATPKRIGLPEKPVYYNQVSQGLWDYMTTTAGWKIYPGQEGVRHALAYPPDWDKELPPADSDIADPFKPYELTWWEAPDCGSELDDLAKSTPFDFVERHAWEGDYIKHEVQIGYPRVGRRRDDLAFIQGDNIFNVVTPEINGDDFANEVLGIGAGEGQGALRRATAIMDGRLRRSCVLAGKEVDDADRMDMHIAAELRRRQNPLTIKSIDVRNHPNAPIGSWALGDDILVRATLPWVGDIELWCRITGWSLTSPSSATLTLERSDAFTYGSADLEVVGPEEGPGAGPDGETPYPSNDLYPSDNLYPNEPLTQED